MGRRVFTREYKLEAARLVTERGVSLAQPGAVTGQTRSNSSQMGAVSPSALAS
jgi:transposase-like protein